MSTHHLDPRHDEPCRKCKGDGRERVRNVPAMDYDACPTCHGTGKRSGKACIRTAHLAQIYEPGWYWTDAVEERHDAFYRGPFPTESGALFAARCALAGVDVEEATDAQPIGPYPYPYIEGWHWSPKSCPDASDWHGPYPTRDAALCAALDARQKRKTGGLRHGRPDSIR